ncbi:MAG TPA: ribonuclease E activity regulator RraA [Candidatus Hydrogenedentes bacterium]|nr:ribonuclease E activity regulator RraA [Candidatus Hydrogenedentota bacterium]
MNFATADLCDQFEDRVRVVEGPLRDFGGRPSFHGRIETVKTFEDNSLVRACLDESGQGRVLVVDGGGSLRRALLGDQLAALAFEHDWSGLVINGCIRDAAAIAQIDLGVKALATHPRKTLKQGFGERGVSVRFGNVDFVPGHYLYADQDGVVIAETALL